MKVIRHPIQVLAASACFLMVSATYGAVFDYTYTFGDGLVASGSLTGTQNGNSVENAANVTLFFNGAQIPGLIFSFKYDSTSPNSYVSGPVLSFNALENNFFFSKSDMENGVFTDDSLFYVLTAFGFNTAVGLHPLNNTASQDLPIRPGSWSLTSRGSVPDGGTTLAMFGIGLAALMWIRRRM